jgi:hypothetical protein
MNARWVLNNPSPSLPQVAYTRIAHWLPWRYYVVLTVEVWSDKSDPMYILMEETFGIPKEKYKTIVIKCNKDGIPKNNSHYYSEEYIYLSDAESGHKKIVELLSKGKLKLKRQSQNI